MCSCFLRSTVALANGGSSPLDLEARRFGRENLVPFSAVSATGVAYFDERRQIEGARGCSFGGLVKA